MVGVPADSPLNKLTARDRALRQSLLDQAERDGNAVVQVAGDERGAPYCFTVGAWRRFGVAEAVVVGLPTQLGGQLVGAYVQACNRGIRFRPGELYDCFFTGVPVTLEKVAKGYYPEYFGSAFLLHPTGDFPAVQLLVPAANGHWPWHPSAPSGFSQWQPVLTDSGRPESWIPGVDGP
ncbi:MAG: DUF4262 domain-containing protein [Kutzneria sp.]|nr:DUF4262 domain-containing protein [Kutzneria sp.]MBV9845839.1 DUF4262 domain-containing protein [Kutzneria sp.]